MRFCVFSSSPLYADNFQRFMRRNGACGGNRGPIGIAPKSKGQKPNIYNAINTILSDEIR